MKALCAAVGFAGILAAGSANAAGVGPGVLPPPPGQSAIFSSFVSNSFDTNSVALHEPQAAIQGGSPAAQQFTVPGTETLLGLTFELSDDTASTDGGSLAVDLVPNMTGTPPLPSSSGIGLTNVIPLGTILDSSLSATSSPVSIAIDDVIAAGTYWIALVGSNTAMDAVWYRTGDLIGLDVGNDGGGTCTINTTCGLYNAHVSGSGSNTGTAIVSVTGNSFELQIDAAAVPEPASLALLGAGLAGLGIVRRRRANKSAG